MAHNSSLPVADREDDTPEKFVIKWGGLVVAIHPEDGLVCVAMTVKGNGGWMIVIEPDDVARVTTTTPFFLPEMFKELNEALRLTASVALDQRGKE